jgi:RimJ/RimL family protein N-acetyltransferase
MVDVPTLETPRLRLRGYRIDDFEAVAAMWAEPAVVRYIGGVPSTRESTWSRFVRQIGLWHYLGFGFFAVEDKATGAFIGEAGFQDLKRNLTPSIEGTMETGWALIGAMQGKGLAEEAVRAAIGWADAAHAERRMTCIINPENGGSLRVAEKLGFGNRVMGNYNGNAVAVLERVRD